MKMETIINKLSILFLTGAIILTTSCSSDGGAGVSTNATISDTNAQALAIAGTEGVKQAVDSDTVSPFAKINNTSTTGDFTVALAQQLSADPKLAEQTIDICEFGNVIMNINESNGSGSIAYNSCVIGDSLINGSANFTSSKVGSITTTTVTFVDLTITFNGETETIDMSATCIFNSDTASMSCSYNSTALGIDGRTYSVSNVTVTGDNLSGYSVSATISDPDHGNITISTGSPITLNCSNDQPGSGSIIITDGSNSMTVTFNSCSSYTVTLNGNSNLYDW